ncbi:TetR family transcriptional regulator C-terminal domain-containing protein (plasmid) [Herbiconiux sp. KACC 21604]|uniref:TetR/AcrR family transcriptional regulator n=1 Tax=Herbiconiux sp. KACC 21604 TaxID=3092664 RepID=UPI00388E966F|nr:TetR family transcriptional regulator C-terminal domain-containing protein [Herbiconiux sp. KACC 21604]
MPGLPRPLDLPARREAIAQAAFRLLAREGSRGLTVKALAAELGGSTTLITHIYPRKSDIYDGMLASLEEDLATTLSRVPSSDDPVAGLRAFLMWCIPLNADEIEEERLRLVLLDQAEHDPRIRTFLIGVEQKMRTLFRQQLAPLVPADQIEPLTLLLRALTNGATLGSIEHPEKWDAHRVGQVIDHLVDTVVRPRVGHVAGRKPGETSLQVQ